MTPSADWWSQARRYRVFAPPGKLDFSDQAAEEMFLYETFGIGSLQSSIFLSSSNGYLIGKRYLNLQIATWKQDIEAGWLTKQELYADPKFQSPEDQAWLHGILDDVIAGTSRVFEYRDEAYA